jgi:hypothetical protein
VIVLYLKGEDIMLERICKRNVVRYAVQQQMFCPMCGICLDMERAVLVNNRVCCEGCYLLACRERPLHVAKQEILDGRILWGRKSARAVDHTKGCHRHEVVKFGCRLCAKKRDKLQRLANQSAERIENAS